MISRLLKRLFPKDHSVCAKCGVHFEPVTGYEARWGGLCSEHRKEVRARDEKKDLVTRWAERNWEKLYDQAFSEENEAHRMNCEAFNRAMNSAMANAQNQAMNSQLSGLNQAAVMGCGRGPGF